MAFSEGRAAEIGARGGSRSTPAKAEAARRNGVRRIGTRTLGERLMRRAMAKPDYIALLEALADLGNKDKQNFLAALGYPAEPSYAFRACDLPISQKNPDEKHALAMFRMKARFYLKKLATAKL